jgi:hypothetical protein
VSSPTTSEVINCYRPEVNFIQLGIRVTIPGIIIMR